MIDHVIVDHPHQLIDQKGLFFSADMPGGGPGGEPGGDLGPARAERIAQQLDHLRTRASAAATIDQFGNDTGQRAPIDDRALFGDAA
jgi:hypothetical protein